MLLLLPNVKPEISSTISSLVSSVVLALTGKQQIKEILKTIGGEIVVNIINSLPVPSGKEGEENFNI